MDQTKETAAEEKPKKKIYRVCPKCGSKYDVYPAISRIDRKEICPDCGVREALDAYAASKIKGQTETVQ